MKENRVKEKGKGEEAVYVFNETHDMSCVSIVFEREDGGDVVR